MLYSARATCLRRIGEDVEVKAGDWVTKTTDVVGWEISQAESKDGNISLIAIVEPIMLRLSSTGSQLSSQLGAIEVGHDFWRAGIDFPNSNRLSWRVFAGTLPNTNRDRFPDSLLGVSRLPWQGQPFGLVRSLLIENIERSLQSALRKAAAHPELTAKDRLARTPSVGPNSVFELEADCIATSLDLVRNFVALDDYIPDLPVPASP